MNIHQGGMQYCHISYKEVLIIYEAVGRVDKGPPRRICDNTAYHLGEYSFYTRWLMLSTVITRLHVPLG